MLKCVQGRAAHDHARRSSASNCWSLSMSILMLARDVKGIGGLCGTVLL